jgi:ribosomal-protein-alanine N-acetyltransferase
MSHDQQPALIGFRLFDSDGQPYKGGSVSSVSLNPSDVVGELRLAMVNKNPNKLSSVDSAQLKIYKNKTAFVGKEETLEDDCLVSGLGLSDKEALVALVPTPTVSNCPTKQPQSQYCPSQAADGFKRLETAIIPSVGTDIILIPRTEFDLSLRPIELSDAESIAFHGNNPNVCKFLRNTFPSPYTISDAFYFINKIAHHQPDRFRAISVCGSDKSSQVIGIISLVDLEYESAELGYWLSEGYWGKGIMTETVRVFISKYLKERFPSLNRLVAKVVDKNHSSIKTLMKNGFVVVAHQKDALLRQGIVYDEVILTLDMHNN